MEQHYGADRTAEWFEHFNDVSGQLSPFPELGVIDPKASTRTVKIRKLLILDPPLDFAVYYRVMPRSVDIMHIRHCARRSPRKGSIGR